MGLAPGRGRALPSAAGGHASRRCRFAAPEVAAKPSKRAPMVHLRPSDRPSVRSIIIQAQAYPSAPSDGLLHP